MTWSSFFKDSTPSPTSTTIPAPQHAGLARNIKDHRFSSREMYLNPILSFLYWKMEYHLTHHMFPTVPSYKVTSSITLGAAEDVSRIKICFNNLTVESGGSPDKPYNPADDEWKFLAREPVTQNQVDEILSKVELTKSWYAGMFDEIAKKLDGHTSDEVTLLNARESLEFVTAVYNSSREGKNIYLPIKKGNPLYNSWLPN